MKITKKKTAIILFVFILYAKHLELEVCLLHQSSESSLLIDLTIRISFCNTAWKCSNVEKNKQTNKKKTRSNDTDPIRAADFSSYDVIFYILNCPQSNEKISDHFCMRRHFSYFQSTSMLSYHFWLEIRYRKIHAKL